MRQPPAISDGDSWGSFSSADTESFSRLEPLPQRSANLVSPAPSARGESTRVDLGSDTTNYCPPSIEVYLKENQNLRSVAWEEPRFAGKLLKIYKSHVRMDFLNEP